MINSKWDYLHYIEADLIWRFQLLLRKAKYFNNVRSKKSFVCKLKYLIIKRKLKTLSLKLGFSIPENVIIPRLAIMH